MSPDHLTSLGRSDGQLKHVVKRGIDLPSLASAGSMGSRSHQCGAVRLIRIGGSRVDIGRSDGSVIDSAGWRARSGRSLATSTVPDGGSRRSERVEVISVVEVEMLKVVVHVVGCWESNGIGWDGVAGGPDVGLNAVRVDLGVIGVVHGNYLMSNEVGTDDQRAERTSEKGENSPRRDLGWDMESPSLGSRDGLGCKLLSVPTSFGDLEPLKTRGIDTVTSGRRACCHILHDGTWQSVFANAPLRKCLPRCPQSHSSH